MKHYNLIKCNCKSHFCEMNSNEFVFYHNLEFFIVSSNICQKVTDLGSKENIINQVLDTTERIDTLRPYHQDGRMALDKSLKEQRLRGLSLDRSTYEVNFIYQPVGRGEKCIATAVQYIEIANKRDELVKEYKETSKYLNEKGFGYLISEVKNLFSHNLINQSFTKDLEIEQVKTINNLVKTIKHDIKHKS